MTRSIVRTDAQPCRPVRRDASGVVPFKRLVTSDFAMHDSLLARFLFCSLLTLSAGWCVAAEDQLRFMTVEPLVRICTNAPANAPAKDAAPKRVLLFALPNGNTLEQTLGCRMSGGLDWHYDIQHILAQTRLLRTLAPNETITLVCAEAGGLSWPSWRGSRPDGNARIAAMADQWRREFGGDDAVVTLSGHSGGGSFKCDLKDEGCALSRYAIDGQCSVHGVRQAP